MAIRFERGLVGTGVLSTTGNHSVFVDVRQDLRRQHLRPKHSICEILGV